MAFGTAIAALLAISFIVLPMVSPGPVEFGTDFSQMPGLALSSTRGDSARRYDGMNFTVAPRKNENLTLLISITSAPGNFHLRLAIRQTWGLPCYASPSCDIRFFIDIMNISTAFPEVKKENDTYQDIVIRGKYCKFMEERHVYPLLNYGNTFKRPWVYGGGGVPYYHFRGIYKLDWKICFSKWADAHNKMAAYHMYTEDDSFVCTENLLHQLLMLEQMDAEGKIPLQARNWRVGDPKWDGFDDNLTIMTKGIAQAFAEHYPEPGFNCSKTVDDGNPAVKEHLSWGNSWMSKHCGWATALYESFNISFITPWLWTNVLGCIPRANLPLYVNTTQRPSAVPTPVPTSNSTTFRKIEIRCPNNPATIHNKDAGRMIRYEKYIENACEFIFVVHKVHAGDMWFIWDNATGTNYHNLTAVFLLTGTGGWHEIVKGVREREENCHAAANETECLKWRRERTRRRLGKSDEGSSNRGRRGLSLAEGLQTFYPGLWV